MLNFVYLTSQTLESVCVLALEAQRTEHADGTLLRVDVRIKLRAAVRLPAFYCRLPIRPDELHLGHSVAGQGQLERLEIGRALRRVLFAFQFPEQTRVEGNLTFIPFLLRVFVEELDEADIVGSFVYYERFDEDVASIIEDEAVVEG